jgi:hypothetical protein
LNSSSVIFRRKNGLSLGFLQINCPFSLFLGTALARPEPGINRTHHTLNGFHPEKGQISRPEIMNHARVAFPQCEAALQTCRKCQPAADLVLGAIWRKPVDAMS